MGNKYYTPELEEFHIGFECEFRNNIQYGNLEFKKEITDWELMSIAFDSYEHTMEEYKKEFRVKYLDREDIENLGWIYDSKDFYHLTINNRLYRLRWFPNNAYNWVGIYSLDANIILTLFDGSVKNKTELKILMKKLQIDGSK